MKQPPKVIFLQYAPDPGPEDQSTWCQDRVNDEDVRYVRQDFPPTERLKMSNPMIGKYVIVRCKDAGVHAGFLASESGRRCDLKQSRRLWYWKPLNGSAFLSGVSVYGLDGSSKVGVTEVFKTLTENCEITECTQEASESIKCFPEYKP